MHEEWLTIEGQLAVKLGVNCGPENNQSLDEKWRQLALAVFGCN